jgi:hypothetical protein
MRGAEGVCDIFSALVNGAVFLFFSFRKENHTDLWSIEALGGAFCIVNCSV